MSGNLSKSAKVVHFRRIFDREEGINNECWLQKTKSDCSFVWYQNIRSPFSFVTIHASDGRTELRQQYRALHCSRTIKTQIIDI